MTHLTSEKETSRTSIAERIAAIRKRAEAQQSRYGFRWNQLLRDRRDLLREVDRLTLALQGVNKHPEECDDEGGACVSHLAYEELRLKYEKLRKKTARNAT